MSIHPSCSKTLVERECSSMFEYVLKLLGSIQGIMYRLCRVEGGVSNFG
jgi:hypothetical protein